MARTLLQLVNAVREEGGVSGGTLATLASARGETLRIKNHVIKAWKEIQSILRDATFMRGDYSFATSDGDGDISSAGAGIASGFLRFSKTRCTCYVTATGVADEFPLAWMPFEAFREVYLTGSQVNGRPESFSVNKAGELLLGPKPNSTGYTITGEYEKSVTALSADDDAPDIPEQDEVIEYRALMKYARFEAAAEIYDDAKANYNRIMSDLRTKYLPEITLGEPLT